jgi:DNA-binding MarR family transcriptional regulator
VEHRQVQRAEPDWLRGQPTRRRILDLVEAEPGLRVGTIAARLGRSYASVRRHVQLLEGAGLIEASEDLQRRIFPRGMPPAARRGAGAALSPSAGLLLAHLAERGPMDGPTLRSELGWPASTVTKAVGRLATAGLVDTRRERGRIVVALALPRAPWLPVTPRVVG